MLRKHFPEVSKDPIQPRYQNLCPFFRKQRHALDSRVQVEKFVFAHEELIKPYLWDGSVVVGLKGILDVVPAQL